MTPAEESAYDSIDFDVDGFRESVGAKRLPTEDKKTLLIRRWREPRLVGRITSFQYPLKSGGSWSGRSLLGQRRKDRNPLESDRKVLC